jgi:hypothetical protein
MKRGLELHIEMGLNKIQPFFSPNFFEKILTLQGF